MLGAEVDLLDAILLLYCGGGVAEDLGAEVAWVADVATGFEGDDGYFGGGHVRAFLGMLGVAEVWMDGWRE